MNSNGTSSELSTCGCCGSAAESAPKPLPGQPLLVFPGGAQPDVLRRMLLRLSAWQPPDRPGERPLAALTTRSPDDPAMALLDAWAVACDVLAFYAARIANEGYLRTAGERRSVRALADAIGYQLDPGVAAATYLAFQLEQADLAPTTVTIPKGTQVMNVPKKQGALPQTFETEADFDAHVEWNRLTPRLNQPRILGAGDTEAYLDGVATGLAVGDVLLFVGADRETNSDSGSWEIRRVLSVEPDSSAATPATRVTWSDGLNQSTAAAANPRVFACRRRAALFGYNAPDVRVMPDNVRTRFGVQNDEWPSFWIPNPEGKLVHLDAVYSKIAAGSWVALVAPSVAQLFRVADATVDWRAAFALTAQVTRLTVDTAAHLDKFPLRGTAVYAEAEELALADLPLTELSGSEIDLASQVAGLTKGQRLLVSGTAADSGAATVELVQVQETRADNAGRGVYTTVLLAGDALAHRYRRDSVGIYANVVAATHGATILGEVLGSGDGTKGDQRFTLKSRPLTYVPAVTPRGSASTLSVRVAGMEWTEVASLYGRGAAEKAYLVRSDDDQNATVIFGDGQRGARLPTGLENVVATYRTGLGQAGNVDAGSLILLKSRPLGVKSVTNPLASSGGADAEALAYARRNAPTTVLTLDRIVSLVDLENFARVYAGIGKASAVALAMLRGPLAHLTIAAADGSAVDFSSELYTHLLDAIDAARDPGFRVRVDSFQKREFRLSARVLYDPKYAWETVQDALTASLRDAFSFANRMFGQPVSSAEVLAVMHTVAGVSAVDLDEFYRLQSDGTRAGELRAELLPAAVAEPDAARTDVMLAELLLLAEDGVALTQMEQKVRT